MEIIKQICEMCRYKNQSNATFPCVDCCSRDRWELAETIVVSSKDIEAQQQEIGDLKQNLKIQEAITMREMGKVTALTTDKDEQAGRIMQLDSGLKKLRASLQWLKETIRDLDYKAWAEDNIGKIDALLGGIDG